MKLPKTYNPADYEANIYALWESSGAFSPTGQGKPYSIVMPPPNANANLHIGHALFVTLEDILIRYHRMKGRDTIWIPGADHAGFETWTVFEKHLESIGDSRFNHTRDELYRMTWDFVAQNRAKMEMQIRALGASCDWNNNFFTLDREVVDVIFTTFKKLWDDGLIYRGERIVNFCTYHQTSFADIEIVYREEKGKLWYIDYPLSDGSGSVTVATTRPETMLGDEAVAVNPTDKRYAKLIGQSLNLPLTSRTIPIIADSAVESGFGTGAVKVTPAHDPTDFEIAERHNLPIKSIIGFDGLMIPPTPEEFVSLDVDTARQQVVEQLVDLGLISKIEDYRHQVPHCYKCGRVIQPLVKDQWFVSVKPLVKPAIKAIKDGAVKFTPKQKADELIRYYEELRDWNISRQIPWGIPIPAFQNVDDPSKWVFDTRVDKRQIELDGQVYRRDEDTFDTWFSSGQWPYVVTRGDLKRFYPTSVMETGIDILRAWVSRMIMLGLYISPDVPFREVYFHGLVNDEHNQKMSKSKSNVINPMSVVEQSGADAMRLGVIANRSAALSQAFSPATVVAGRNFCNKLWNIARFISEQPKGDRAVSETLDIADLSLADHWILRQLDQARTAIDQLLGEFRFAEAYETLYHVIWNDLADWWVEASKAESSAGDVATVGQFVLRYCLKLAHPFAPFVTETIWQSISGRLSVEAADQSSSAKPAAQADAELLIAQPWPTKLKYSAKKADEFDEISDIVREVRKAKIDLGGGSRTLSSDDDFIQSHANLIKSLAKVEVVRSSRSGLRLNLATRVAFLTASDAQIAQLEQKKIKQQAEIAAKIKQLEARLANKSYLANAPAVLIDETRAELELLRRS
jgi:valyl-tRNA synthetase